MIDPLLALSLLTWGFLVLVGIVAVMCALTVHWHRKEERAIKEYEDGERHAGI
jgi:protein-S-isoprenylcysteine O-methyltransferase Ste14